MRRAVWTRSVCLLLDLPQTIRLCNRLAPHNPGVILVHRSLWRPDRVPSSEHRALRVRSCRARIRRELSTPGSVVRLIHRSTQFALFAITHRAVLSAWEKSTQLPIHRAVCRMALEDHIAKVLTEAVVGSTFRSSRPRLGLEQDAKGCCNSIRARHTGFKFRVCGPPSIPAPAKASQETPQPREIQVRVLGRYRAGAIAAIHAPSMPIPLDQAATG